MAQPIRQIAPGIVHWTAPHPRIGMDVSSYALTRAGVLFDPLTPAEGLDWFEEHGVPVRDVLLSNRHHLRHAPAFAERYGCAIHAARAGMHEFAPQDGVVPFDAGQALTGGVVAHEVAVICPDETAFEVPDARALVVADGVISHDGLQFVPDHLIGDDPPAIRKGLLARYAQLVEEVDFDHLLTAHGDPIVGTGRAALRDFVAGV